MGRRGRPGSPPLVVLGGGADDTDGEALEGREGGFAVMVVGASCLTIKRS